MMVKKIRLFCLLTILVLCLTGCDEEKLNENVTNAGGSTIIKQTIVDSEVNENGTGSLICKSEATAGENIEVEIGYTLNYKRGNILELHSVQKIVSSDQSSLDSYESAFSSIAKNYDGLDYYDTSIVRDSNSVTYDININYDKIDTKEILAIEGEEDNIIKNGKAKLSLWLDLASKFGVTCEEA